MRTNVVLDDELVSEAFTLTGAQTKKELIHLALQTLVRIRRKKDLTELAGKIRLRDDYDHKALRDLPGIYFDLRRIGLTVRSPIDCCIAQLSLEHDVTLLHRDRDFESIARIRPLRQVRLDWPVEP